MSWKIERPPLRKRARKLRRVWDSCRLISSGWWLVISGNIWQGKQLTRMYELICRNLHFVGSYFSIFQLFVLTFPSCCPPTFSEMANSFVETIATDLQPGLRAYNTLQNHIPSRYRYRWFPKCIPLHYQYWQLNHVKSWFCSMRYPSWSPKLPHTSLHQHG